MALAIQFDQLINDGRITDQAELARLGRVTRARVTQIMDLLNLVPEIQGEILGLSPTSQRFAVISERYLRPICREIQWRKQRVMWIDLTTR